MDICKVFIYNFAGGDYDGWKCIVYVIVYTMLLSFSVRMLEYLQCRQKGGYG